MSLLILPPGLAGQGFGEIGTQWHYSEHAGGLCPGNCEYLHLESVLDTLISGQTTHKILQTYYTHTGDTVHLSPIYVYEKSDTVFTWSFLKSRFLTTYIFNPKAGDTLTLDVPENQVGTDTTYRLLVDSVISEMVDGIPLKKYHTWALDNYRFWNGGYYMDRIGGLDWFFPRAFIIPEAGGPIRCYSDAQIDTNFQAIACDLVVYSGIEIHAQKYEIDVYPNPTSALLNIRSSEQIERMELFDLSGKAMGITMSYSSEISALPDGEYVLKIHLSEGPVIKKKVIKITD